MMEYREQSDAESCLLEKENMRQYDERSGLWYLIYWHEDLKCYVSQLAPGQKPVVTTLE